MKEGAEMSAPWEVMRGAKALKPHGWIGVEPLLPTQFLRKRYQQAR